MLNIPKYSYFQSDMNKNQSTKSEQNQLINTASRPKKREEQTGNHLETYYNNDIYA